MRLAQLARKLSLRPDQIIEFLAKQNIQIEDGSNTRLEDNHVELIVKKFAPAGFEITPQELRVEEMNTETLPPLIVEAPEIEKPEMKAVERAETAQEIETSLDKTEVIKAPKIELSGLKVLGKIDLPEPKKKELPATEPPLDNEGNAESKPQKRINQTRNRDPRTNPRPAKNPIALQREREEREAQKKREESRALEKEKRSQHYFNKVKVVAPIKTIKREQIIEEIPEATPQPKTWLGKFFKWFTT
ncbi:MAG TPA: hypothetical protein VFE57_07255 [Cyclobacteriaceae bacterium]|nr:hypothetical protein [Cyclobacteriaceae bacterium]